MVLRSVTTLNNAVYQCNASNQYGYLLANAFVNVLRKSLLKLPATLDVGRFGLKINYKLGNRHCDKRDPDPNELKKGNIAHR